MLAQLHRPGLVEYEDGLRMQERLVPLIQAEQTPQQVFLLEHPHVITLGRRASPANVLIDAQLRRLWQVQLHESVRGGDVTYHGPGQLVLYPLLALPPARQDLVRYVRDLEEVMIRTLADFGLAGGRIAGLTGAWVGDDKIGAIGVRMARWVTSHGLALNVNTDLRYFDLIVPCGIRDHGVTSMQRLLGAPVPLEQVAQRLLHHLAEIFDLELIQQPVHLKSIQAIIFRHRNTLETLILRRVPEKGGFWQPVTGRIEQDESPLHAAQREIEEETGFRGEVLSLDYTHGLMLEPDLLPSSAPKPFMVEEHSFYLEISAEQEVKLEAGAHDAFEWLPWEEAAQKVRWPGNREGILRAGEKLLGHAAPLANPLSRADSMTEDP